MTLIQKIAKAIELRDTTDSLAIAREAVKTIQDHYENMSAEAEAQGHRYLPYWNIALAMKDYLNE